MKNKKYYTPAIEEFHIGFEYEYLEKGYEYIIQQIGKSDTYKVLSKPKLIDPYWKKSKFNLLLQEDNDWGLSIQAISKCIENKECRVRYLDQDDIEDLGFELLPRYSNSTGTYESQSGWQLNYHHPEHGGNCWTEIYGNIPDSIDLRFKGIIKNKSELTRILKSIGYA